MKNENWLDDSASENCIEHFGGVLHCPCGNMAEPIKGNMEEIHEAFLGEALEADGLLDYGTPQSVALTFDSEKGREMAEGMMLFAQAIQKIKSALEK